MNTGNGSVLKLLESFRFQDENDYEDEIFLMNNIERALTSVILAGKTSPRRHFSTKQVNNTVAVLAFFDQQKRLSYQQ